MSTDAKPDVVIVRELGFVLHVSDYPHEEGEEPSSVSFVAYEATGLSSDGEVVYEATDERGHSYSSGAITQADKYIEGYVRWDGCSNWDFNQGHFCNVSSAERLGKLLRACYEIAALRMPRNADEVMEEVINFGWMFDEAEAPRDDKA